jgi:malate dehydrogenase
MSRRKITVVGAGNVGATTAQRLAERDYADVVLVDIVEGLPQGKGLDLAEAAPVVGHDARVTGTNDYVDTAGSDIVVVTSGLARQPGMSRDDLLAKNAGIVRAVVEQAAKHSPDAILIIVTNPLDEMTHLAWQVSGLPEERVMGMAGVLDSARYRFLLGEALGVPPAEVEAATLGSHGETMVPIYSLTRFGGRAVTDLLPRSTLQRIAARTRDAGAEIVSLLGRGSAFHAPAASIAAMVEAVVDDRKQVLPTCAMLRGQYGSDGVFLGVPAKIGRRGVEEIVEWPLAADEEAALREAAAKVAERCRDLQTALAAT